MAGTTTSQYKAIKVEQDNRLWSRILQELVVGIAVHYIFYFAFACVILVFIYQAGYTLYAVPFILLYLPSFLDGAHMKNGRPWAALRKAGFWHYAHKHCGMEAIRTAELPGGKKYIIGISPHGILILSRVLMYGGVVDELFPEIEFRVLGATPMFYVPFCREICLWLGAIDASRSSAERALKAGLSLMIYPGGSKEIFHTRPGSKETTIVLNERLGFVKLAIQQGASLVPSVVFGEKEAYHKLEISEDVKSWFLKTLKIPLLLFWGKYFTWIPLRKPLVIIFGAPIPVKQNPNPTQEEIEECHKIYIEQYTKLFEENKHKYSFSKDQKLVIT